MSSQPSRSKRERENSVRSRLRTSEAHERGETVHSVHSREIGHAWDTAEEVLGMSADPQDRNVLSRSSSFLPLSVSLQCAVTDADVRHMQDMHRRQVRCLYRPLSLSPRTFHQHMASSG